MNQMDPYKIKYRQYVIVPKHPKMSPGKIASQVAHATFMGLSNQVESSSKHKNNPVPAINTHTDICEWKEEGMCVIVLECKDATQLMGIAKYLEQWKVPHHMYIDEGLTEVDMGTPTALATGVLPNDHDWMFSTLKLYTEEKPKWWR